MDLLVIGNVSLDTIEIGSQKVETIGGTGYYMAYAASLTGCTVFLAAIVGTDFPFESMPKMKQLNLKYLKSTTGSTTRFTLRYDDTKALKNIISNFNTKIIDPRDTPSLAEGTYVVHLTSKDPILPENFITTFNSSVFSTDVSLSSLEKKRASIQLLLPYIKYIFLNLEEYHQCSNWLKFSDHPNLTVIVTNDKSGVQVYKNNNVILDVPAYKAHLVDPTGAGDVLAGGCVGMLCQNKDLVAALSVGSALASICVEGWGASRITNASSEEIYKRTTWIQSRVKKYAE